MKTIEVMRTETTLVETKVFPMWIQEREKMGWAVRQIVANPNWRYVIVVLEDNR